MRITAIKAWQVDLPLREGRYNWSDGNFVEVFDSTVVAVETDAGITGYAECCPLGSAYLPAYAKGVRAGLEEIGPKIIGLDPRGLWAAQPAHGCGAARPPLREGADRHRLLGHPRQGRRAAGLHSCSAAPRRTTIELYRAITPGSRRRNGARRSPATAPRATPSSSSRSAAMPTTTSSASTPCRAMLEPTDILVADANTGWTMAEAVRIVIGRRERRRLHRAALPDLRGVPVGAPAHRAAVRARRGDRRHRRRWCAASPTTRWTSSISRSRKVGGLTKARLMRDLCVAQGIPMTIEDTWGGDIVTATIAHLARSTPAEFCFSATDFNSYGTVTIADGAPKRVDGRMTASDRARPRHRAGDEGAGQAGADRGQGLMWRASCGGVMRLVTSLI